jgi:2-methylisocitrate lyase-like PEP mutase family enzyme
MTTEQAQRARTFANLHQAGEPLLLPNAWDVASAVAIAGAATELLTSGTYDAVADGVAYGTLNAAFTP